MFTILYVIGVRRLTIHAVHDDNVDQIVIFNFYNFILYSWSAFSRPPRSACMKDNIV